MTVQFNHKVIRRPETLSIIGCSKTTLHNLQKKQLFVSSISVGERAVGYLAEEVQAIVAARAANQTESQIRSLVKRLEEQRKQSANAFLNAIAA